MDSKPAFRWVSGWGQTPDRTSSRAMAHHGIAVTTDGLIVSFAPEGSRLEFRDPDGRLITGWPAPVTQGHGLRVARTNEEDTFWIADNGDRWVERPDGSYGSEGPPGERISGSVVQLSAGGQELMRIRVPGHPAYEAGDFCPTDMAIDSVSEGGDGSIWVADGYGQSLVHRFGSDGNLIHTLSGLEGAGRFASPHAILMKRRGDQVEIYVADRGNARLQVFSRDGVFLRVVGAETLISPSGLAAYGSGLVIAELDGRIVVLDEQDQVALVMGTGTRDGRSFPGWPNAMDEHGSTVRPHLVDGPFHTPHGVAVDANGNLYVSEWVIGGRLIKLEPVTSAQW